ncbi:hypothetical protein BJ085DRAFT_6752, partial [Dimargaris cristalligena]
KPDLFDVVIVGGGIAGATLARGIGSNPALANRRVALIESSDLNKVRQWDTSPSLAYSNRTVSITPASQSTLVASGIWPHLDATRIQPYTDMKVWDGVSDGRVHFSARDLPELSRAGNRLNQQQPMAWILENLNLHRAALRAVDEVRDRVEIMDQTKVDHISLAQPRSTASPNTTPTTSPGQGGAGSELDWPVLRLSSGRTLQTRLLIGADGANSPVRRFSNIGSAGWNYTQHGIVAMLKLADSDCVNTTAWQRFLPTGPIALLPMPHNHVALVWSMEKDFVPHLKKLPEAEFVQALNVALRLPFEDLDYLLRHIQSPTPSFSMVTEFGAYHHHHQPPWVAQVEPDSRASFPFKLQHADRYIGQRIALVGDAAHTIHPLAGQGLNLGLLDVASITRALESAALNGQDLGDYNSLLGYSSDRYFANLVMIGAVDKLQKLFSTSCGPLAAVRSLGLNAVNHIPVLK